MQMKNSVTSVPVSRKIGIKLIYKDSSVFNIKTLKSNGAQMPVYRGIKITLCINYFLMVLNFIFKHLFFPTIYIIKLNVFIFFFVRKNLSV